MPAPSPEKSSPVTVTSSPAGSRSSDFDRVTVTSPATKPSGPSVCAAAVAAPPDAEPPAGCTLPAPDQTRYWFGDQLPPVISAGRRSSEVIQAPASVAENLSSWTSPTYSPGAAPEKPLPEMVTVSPAGSMSVALDTDTDSAGLS